MKEKIEKFDPGKLETAGKWYEEYREQLPPPSNWWELEYGVPYDSLAYVADRTYILDLNDEVELPFFKGDPRYPHFESTGFVHAMDRVEELTKQGSAAFVISRPLSTPVRPVDEDGYTPHTEYVVFKANLPKGS